VVSASLRNLDPAIEEAAISLGASRLRAFFLIVLPNIHTGIVAAFIMASISAFNNVPVALFLTGPGVSTLPITMLTYIHHHWDPSVAAVSTLTIILSIGIVLGAERSLGLSRFV
jgi:putative spermidine/putrescine transport system permease protein